MGKPRGSVADIGLREAAKWVRQGVEQDALRAGEREIDEDVQEGRGRVHISVFVG